MSKIRMDEIVVFEAPKTYVAHEKAFTVYQVPFNKASVPYAWTDGAADLGPLHAKIGQRLWGLKGKDDRKVVTVDVTWLASSLNCTVGEILDAMNEMAAVQLIKIKYADEDTAAVLILLDREWLHPDSDEVKRRGRERLVEKWRRMVEE